MRPKNTAAKMVLFSIVGICVVFLLVLFLGPASILIHKLTTDATHLRQVQVSTSTAALIADEKQRDYVSAEAHYQDVMASPDTTADDRAVAILSGAVLRYRITDNEQFLLEHIPLYKSIIEDDIVSLPVRIAAINALASAYCDSGRTWAVFQEIYKGAPYDTFLVANDPDRSARNMFLWSYQQMPSGDAAIALAKNYAGSAIIHTERHQPDLEASDLEQAAYYLQQADILMPQEKQLNGADYAVTGRYAVYMYWRAYTVAILAHYKGEPYMSAYKGAFDDFIAQYSSQPGISDMYLANARLLYGYFLTLNAPTKGANDAAAKVQFDAIVPYVKQDQFFNTNRFVRLIRNENYLRVQKNIKQGPFTSGIAEGQEISPSFAAFVKDIVATPMTSADE